MGPQLRIGVDIGGTFTDFVVLDEPRGRMHISKRLTTPENPADGVLSGLLDVLRGTGFQLAEVDNIVHGTTLATNIVIERKGARVGLVTTKGFRDSIEIGREVRYDSYDLMIQRPEPLVPRQLRCGIAERVAASGEVLVGLRLEDVEPIANAFRTAAITSVAVALLHSYVNPAHERAIAEELRRLLPSADVTISSDVVPEIREYERTVTTVVDAYVKPMIRQYLTHLESELIRLDFQGPLYIMQSNGSLASVAASIAAPVRLIESGPAGGAMAASFYGQMTDSPALLSFDMGGTTAKMCLIEEGEPQLAYEFEAARHHRFKKGSGLPLKVPVIEMIEIGAGGGSIARIDAMGLLNVGPDSAGAAPGPACYGRGGLEPTVTDADLILGYLDPNFFLGGEMKLDVGAAQHAVSDKLASRLGIDLMDAAIGIHELVNENMATATRLHLAESGRELLSYAMLAFGGAGPVHAYAVARLLHLKRLICPLGAGTTSAFWWPP